MCDNLYRRPNFGYRVDEVTSVESTFDDGFWIQKHVSRSENKAGIGYADPFQDQGKACKEESIDRHSLIHS